MSSVSPSAKRAKGGKKADKVAKLYCVIENGDGARIMSVDDANGFLSNLNDERRSLAKMHFAGSLEAAEKLQKVIEDRLLLNSGKFKNDYLCFPCPIEMTGSVGV